MNQPQPRYRYSTKLIKLSNGDDVVGDVDVISLKTSEIIIKNPQKIVTMTNSTHMGMAFVKWVPWNFGDRIPVNKKHVVTVCNTHPTVLEYYKKMESLLVSGLTTVKRSKDTQRGMESV